MPVSSTGSSPRVRSGLVEFLVRRGQVGIISARAERTWGPVLASVRVSDHLRACGADPYERPLVIADLGSSPRVRSGLVRRVRGPRRRGIISACAERTRSANADAIAAGDHLRVCGADLVLSVPGCGDVGSSPRVRSGRWASARPR